MKSNGIHVIAVSPPEFEKNFLEKGKRMSSVNSRTPYSLLAVLERTFHRVREGILDVLNWQDPQSIQESVFLMRHWVDEQNSFIKKVEKIRPDIVLIGTFAMNFPGAIEIAKTVRHISPETLIVLGGRHIGETFWSEIHGASFGEIKEHKEANPLRLMERGEILPVFDLVVSHDGQELIPKIIEKVQKNKNTGKMPRDLVENISVFSGVPGYWTLGKIDKSGKVIYVQPNTYTPIDTSENKSPYVYTGSDMVKFPVFELTDWTAHVHSDSQGMPGNTCTMDCFFCSEARGKMPLKKRHETGAGDRLFSRFCDIMKVAKKDMRVVSIFVEDSILCGGNWGGMERFCDLMEEAKINKKELPMEWGCQFTVPIIMNPRGQKIISRLQNVGLTYIYFGLESAKPEIAKTISKTGGRGGWSHLAEKAVEYLSKSGIKVGTSNIFAMGERHEDRIAQLQLIESWQKKYSGNPLVYSLNLQTVHPGEWGGLYTGQKPSYVTWGLEIDDPRNPLLQELFGEAAIKYLGNPDNLPSTAELSEIRDIISKIENSTVDPIYFSHALGIRKRSICSEVLNIINKKPDEIQMLANKIGRKLLSVGKKGRIFFTPGTTLGLAYILRVIFGNKNIKIVFSDHELKHTQKAIGKGYVTTHDTTWTSFGPPRKTPQYPGQILRQYEVMPDSYVKEYGWGNVRETNADVFYISRISRLTGETLLTPQLYKQLKKNFPGCIVVCDGAQSLGTAIEDVSEYCDVYLGVSSKFIGASPHMGIGWVSDTMLGGIITKEMPIQLSINEYRREYAEFIHYGTRAYEKDTDKMDHLQERIRNIFEKMGLVYVSGKYLLTFSMAPNGYYASAGFQKFCQQMLIFIRGKGINISTNLPQFSIGYPENTQEYLRICVSHETTEEEVDFLEGVLKEFKENYYPTIS